MRAAILQLCAGIDPLPNARNLVEAIERAADDGADILFTPEMTNLIDRDRERAARAIVGEAEDVTLAAACEAAAKHKLWLHIGSLALKRDGDEARLVNCGFVIDAAGAIRARYDKMHLFDVDLAGGESYRESNAYRPGDGAVAVETPWGRLGLTICYDLRFPDLFRALSDAGATILAVPAAFTVPTGSAHWHVLLRARAIEAGAFVIAAAQTGHHADGRATYGHSLAIDPWGEVLCDMGGQPGLATVALDPARIEAARGRIPALRHRRAIGEVAIA